MSAGVAFERFRDALTDAGKNPRESGSEWTAQCPAHDDNSPSLGFRWIEGSLLLHCHAGCMNDEVLAALNLTKRDLYDEPTGATYRYDDGRQVHRTPDKKFRQSGATRGASQLYQLSKVVEAVTNGQTIYLCEGEKDCLALESIGVVATTSPMGATNFHKVDATPLTGAHVVIVADKDAAGTKYAVTASDILLPLGCAVEVVCAKAGKDAADHIAAGYGVNDFVPFEIEEEVTVRRARITWAHTIKPRPVVWAWKDDEGNGRIPAGSLSVAAGREGTGKSSYGIWLAAQITRGTLPGSYFGRPRRVLYVALEDSWEYTIIPRLMAAGADLSMVGRFDVVNVADEEVSLSLPYDNRLLESSVQEHDVALVTIDPIMSVLGEKINASRSKEVRSALDPLVRIADRTGSVILGIAHFNKGSSSDPTLSITESKAFTDVPRSVFTFARDDENECRVMSQTKNSLGKDWSGLTSLKYTIESTVIDTEEGPAEVGMFVWGGVAERSVGDIVRDRGGDQEDRDERNEVDKWLTVFLTKQPQQAGHVFKAADLAGYSKDQAKRAKKRLGISAKHPVLEGPWYWELPTEDEDEDEDESPREQQGSKGAPYTEPCSLRSLGAPLGGDPPRQTCSVCDQILLLTVAGRSVCAARDAEHDAARAAEAVA
jgi:AAA domain/Toprim domain